MVRNFGPEVRYVRTAEGAAFYGVPIGSPIRADIMDAADTRARAQGLKPPKDAASKEKPAAAPKGAKEDGKAAEAAGSLYTAHKPTLSGPQKFKIGSKEYSAPEGARLFRPRDSRTIRYVMDEDGRVYAFNPQGQVTVPQTLQDALREQFASEDVAANFMEGEWEGPEKKYSVPGAYVQAARAVLSDPDASAGELAEALDNIVSEAREREARAADGSHPLTYKALQAANKQRNRPASAADLRATLKDLISEPTDDFGNDLWDPEALRNVPVGGWIEIEPAPGRKQKLERVGATMWRSEGGSNVSHQMVRAGALDAQKNGLIARTIEAPATTSTSEEDSGPKDPAEMATGTVLTDPDGGHSVTKTGPDEWTLTGSPFPIPDSTITKWLDNGHLLPPKAGTPAPPVLENDLYDPAKLKAVPIGAWIEIEPKPGNSMRLERVGEDMWRTEGGSNFSHTGVRNAVISAQKHGTLARTIPAPSGAGKPADKPKTVKKPASEVKSGDTITGIGKVVMSVKNKPGKGYITFAIDLNGGGQKTIERHQDSEVEIDAPDTGMSEDPNGKPGEEDSGATTPPAPAPAPTPEPTPDPEPEPDEAPELRIGDTATVDWLNSASVGAQVSVNGNVNRRMVYTKDATGDWGTGEGKTTYTPEQLWENEVEERGYTLQVADLGDTGIPAESLRPGDRPTKDWVETAPVGSQISLMGRGIGTELRVSTWTKQDDRTWTSSSGRNMNISEDEMVNAVTVDAPRNGDIVIARVGTGDSASDLFPGSHTFSEETLQAALDSLTEHSGFQVFYGLPKNSPLRDKEIVGALTTHARERFPDLSPKEAVKAHLRAYLGLEEPGGNTADEGDTSTDQAPIVVGSASPKRTGVQGMNGGSFKRSDVEQAIEILEAFQGKAFKSELNKKGNALGVLDPASIVGIHKDKTVAKDLFVQHLRGLLDAQGEGGTTDAPDEVLTVGEAKIRIDEANLLVFAAQDEVRAAQRAGDAKRISEAQAKLNAAEERLAAAEQALKAAHAAAAESKAYVGKVDPDVQKYADEAFRLIALTHGAPGVQPDVKSKGGSQGGDYTVGSYVLTVNPNAQSDLGGPSSLSPAGTLIHEYGHFLDNTLFRNDQGAYGSRFATDPHMRAVLDAAMETPGYKDIVLSGQRDPAQDMQEYVAYLTSPAEVFARAYAQWVTEKTGTREAHLDRGKGESLTHKSEDFAPVARALEALFASKGLLPEGGSTDAPAGTKPVRVGDLKVGDHISVVSDSGEVTDLGRVTSLGPVNNNIRSVGVGTSTIPFGENAIVYVSDGPNAPEPVLTKRAGDLEQGDRIKGRGPVSIIWANKPGIGEISVLATDGNGNPRTYVYDKDDEVELDPAPDLRMPWELVGESPEVLAELHSLPVGSAIRYLGRYYLRRSPKRWTEAKDTSPTGGPLGNPQTEVTFSDYDLGNSLRGITVVSVPTSDFGLDAEDIDKDQVLATAEPGDLVFIRQGNSSLVRVYRRMPSRNSYELRWLSNDGGEDWISDRSMAIHLEGSGVTTKIRRLNEPTPPAPPLPPEDENTYDSFSKAAVGDKVLVTYPDGKNEIWTRQADEKGDDGITLRVWKNELGIGQYEDNLAEYFHAEEETQNGFATFTYIRAGETPPPIPGEDNGLGTNVGYGVFMTSNVGDRVAVAYENGEVIRLTRVDDNGDVRQWRTNDGALLPESELSTVFLRNTLDKGWGKASFHRLNPVPGTPSPESDGPTKLASSLDRPAIRKVEAGWEVTVTKANGGSRTWKRQGTPDNALWYNPDNDLLNYDEAYDEMIRFMGPNREGVRWTLTRSEADHGFKVGDTVKGIASLSSLPVGTRMVYTRKKDGGKTAYTISGADVLKTDRGTEVAFDRAKYMEFVIESIPGGVAAPPPAPAPEPPKPDEEGNGRPVRTLGGLTVGQAPPNLDVIADAPIGTRIFQGGITWISMGNYWINSIAPEEGSSTRKTRYASDWEWYFSRGKVTYLPFSDDEAVDPWEFQGDPLDYTPPVRKTGDMLPLEALAKDLEALPVRSVVSVVSQVNGDKHRFIKFNESHWQEQDDYEAVLNSTEVKKFVTGVHGDVEVVFAAPPAEPDYGTPLMAARVLRMAIGDIVVFDVGRRHDNARKVRFRKVADDVWISHDPQTPIVSNTTMVTSAGYDDVYPDAGGIWEDPPAVSDDARHNMLSDLEDLPVGTIITRRRATWRKSGEDEWTLEAKNVAFPMSSSYMADLLMANKTADGPILIQYYPGITPDTKPGAVLNIGELYNLPERSVVFVGSGVVPYVRTEQGYRYLDAAVDMSVEDFVRNQIIGSPGMLQTPARLGDPIGEPFNEDTMPAVGTVLTDADIMRLPVGAKVSQTDKVTDRRVESVVYSPMLITSNKGYGRSSDSLGVLLKKPGLVTTFDGMEEIKPVEMGGKIVFPSQLTDLPIGADLVAAGNTRIRKVSTDQGGRYAVVGRYNTVKVIDGYSVLKDFSDIHYESNQDLPGVPMPRNIVGGASAIDGERAKQAELDAPQGSILYGNGPDAAAYVKKGNLWVPNRTGYNDIEVGNGWGLFSQSTEVRLIANDQIRKPGDPLPGYVTRAMGSGAKVKISWLESDPFGKEDNGVFRWDASAKLWVQELPPRARKTRQPRKLSAEAMAMAADHGVVKLEANALERMSPAEFQTAARRATTPGDFMALLRAQYPDVNFLDPKMGTSKSKWETAMKLEAVKDYYLQAAWIVDTYPMLRSIKHIGAEKESRQSAIAWAAMRMGDISASYTQVNLRYAYDDQDAMLTTQYGSGHFRGPLRPGISEAESTAVHEFGHIFDGAMGVQLNVVARRALDEYTKDMTDEERAYTIKSSISNYGMTNDYELVAESFKDWHVNVHVNALTEHIMNAMRDYIRTKVNRPDFEFVKVPGDPSASKHQEHGVWYSHQSAGSRTAAVGLEATFREMYDTPIGSKMVGISRGEKRVWTKESNGYWRSDDGFLRPENGFAAGTARFKWTEIAPLPTRQPFEVKAGDPLKRWDSRNYPVGTQLVNEVGDIVVKRADGLWENLAVPAQRRGRKMVASVGDIDHAIGFSDRPGGAPLGGRWTIQDFNGSKVLT